MPVLILQREGNEPRVFELQRGPNLLGRAADNAVFVADQSLSRRHACVFVERTGVRLADLGSKNGSFIAGARVRETALSDGESFVCGEVAFIYRDQRPVRSQPLVEIDLTRERPRIDSFWSNLTKNTPSAATPLELQQPQAAHGPTATRGERGRMLLRVSEALAEYRPGEVFERILQLVLEVLPVDHVALFVSERDASSLQLAAADSRPVAANHSHSTHVVEYARERGAAVLFASADVDPRLAGAHSIAEQTIRASMCVPMVLRNGRTGLLYADSRASADALDADDLSFLCAFACYAAIAIDNASLAQQLEEEAVVRSHLLRFFPTGTAVQILASGRASLQPVTRLVTALFCDLTGFTTLSSTLDPRHVIQLLNEYFQMLSAIVFRRGGTLEKYIGDAVLAVWGAPFVTPDDAQHAIRAAIDMQRGFAELHRRWLQAGIPKLGIHIGLDTGLVAAGNIGSDRYLQYATIGEAVTLASRICGVAQAGEILISSATQDVAATSGLELSRMPSIQVKGRPEPLDVYKVLWT